MLYIIPLIILISFPNPLSIAGIMFQLSINLYSIHLISDCVTYDHLIPVVE